MGTMKSHGSPCPEWGLVPYLGVCTCFVGAHPFLMAIAPAGASYLVPFFAGVIVLAAPLVYVQTRLGSEARSGLIGVLSSSFPLFQGIGACVLIRAAIDCMYSSLVAAYSALYVWKSYVPRGEPFPWSVCSNTTSSCSQSWTVFVNSPAQEFFRLSLRESLDQPVPTGQVVIPVLIAMAVVWGVVLLSILFGMRVFSWLMTLFGLIVIGLFAGVLAVGFDVVMDTGYTHDFFTASRQSLRRFRPDIDRRYDFFSELVSPVFNSIWLVLPWFGILPSIGRNRGNGKIARHLNWFPLIVVSSGVSLLVLNAILPYIGVLFQVKPTLLFDVTRVEELLFVLLPQAFTQAQSSRGLVMVFYVATCLIYIQRVALLSACIVDNIVDLIRLCGASKQRLKSRTTTHFLVSILYCVATFGLSVTFTTQSGYILANLANFSANRFLLGFVILFYFISIVGAYVRQKIHTCNKVIFMFVFIIVSLFSIFIAVLAAEYNRSRPRDILIDGGILRYNTAGVALSFVIAIVPLALGLLLGLIITCCCARKIGRGYICFGLMAAPPTTEQDLEQQEKGNPLDEPEDEVINYEQFDEEKEEDEEEKEEPEEEYNDKAMEDDEPNYEDDVTAIVGD